MNKLFIIAGAVILTGGIIFLIALMASGWSFVTLFSEKWSTNSYEITEAFSDIYINSDTADITFLPSEDGSCRVICYERERLKHISTVKDGTLSITFSDKTKWYDHIMAFDNSSVSIYLPLDKYGSLTVSSNTSDIEIPKNFSFTTVDISLSTGDVTSHASADEAIKITASTGKILLDDLSASSLYVKTTTGDISLSDVTLSGDLITSVSTGAVKITDLTCQNLTSDGSTGDINLKNVTAFGNFTLKRSTGKTNMTSAYAAAFSIEADTGDVTFNRCDADEITVKTSTGDVTGTLMSNKIIYAKSSSGKIDVPRSNTGGMCEITTSTGKIMISIVSDASSAEQDK